MSKFGKLLEELASGKGNVDDPYYLMEMRRAADSLKEAHRTMDRHVKDLHDDNGADEAHHRRLLSYAKAHLNDSSLHLDNASEISGTHGATNPEIRKGTIALKHALGLHGQLAHEHEQRYPARKRGRI